MQVVVLNGTNLDVLARRDPAVYGGADGVIVNPGAWTHYSYAIRDALELLSAPIVEVHLSNIEEREEWRRTSVIAELAARRVLGKGPEGYREALEFLVERVGSAR